MEAIELVGRSNAAVTTTTPFVVMYGVVVVSVVTPNWSRARVEITYTS
jgi:hypothetical protein